MTVIIAGGGIAGLSMALTCHAIGIPALVLESVPQIKALGVGINLQPNAVRELGDMHLGDRLDDIGVATREWALVGRNGNDIWSEPRGLAAGYRWPQYSVHRGSLQMLLAQAVRDRLGAQVIRTGHRVLGYANTRSGVDVHIECADGSRLTEHAQLLIAADGIHSAVRAQMMPGEGEPRWGGAIMWRGACPGVPIRTGASFVGVGSLDQRVVCYPISQTDPGSGLATINWIAEITVDTATPRSRSDWNRPVAIERFLPQFEDWNFGWLDVPAMVRATEVVLEYPMVDRDPIANWVDGRVVLIGDAAHAMYPVGSNGASQAIVDARVLGAALVAHGVNRDALLDFEDQLREPVSALVLRNRQAGPFGMLGMVDERCKGVFDAIEDVIPRAEIDDFMKTYQRAAGLAIETLNDAPATIKPGAKVRQTH